MSLPKGSKPNNPAGRPKGSVNPKTVRWNELQDALFEVVLPKAVEYLEQTDPKEAYSALITLLEYFKPKMQRSEVKNDTNITYTVVSPFNLPEGSDSESQ